jgi:hypothetical protein
VIAVFAAAAANRAFPASGNTPDTQESLRWEYPSLDEEKPLQQIVELVGVES